MKEGAPSLTVHKGRDQVRIPYTDIVYLEQRLHQVDIVRTNGQVVTIYGKITEILPQLDEHSFIRTHKSYCVNLRCVRALNQELKCFVMRDGSNIPIGRDSYTAAKKSYEDFLFGRARESVNE